RSRRRPAHAGERDADVQLGAAGTAHSDPRRDRQGAAGGEADRRTHRDGDGRSVRQKKCAGKQMNAHVLLIASSLALLAGCATVSADYRRPAAALIDAPAAQATFAHAGEQQFSASSPPSRWWQLYNDPVLNALVEQALHANTDLRVAKANIARARAG